MIEQSVALARLLAAVARRARGRRPGRRGADAARRSARNAILFELLNQMDGLAEDADIIFLLTTNRPDLLEPALAVAARPRRPGDRGAAAGRDVPPTAVRRSTPTGLELDGVDFDPLVERTHGVSGAFIRELLRKAALLRRGRERRRRSSCATRTSTRRCTSSWSTAAS